MAIRGIPECSVAQQGEYPAHTVSHCVKMNGETLCIKVIEMTATFAVARVTGTVKSK